MHDVGDLFLSSLVPVRNPPWPLEACMRPPSARAVPPSLSTPPGLTMHAPLPNAVLSVLMSAVRCPRAPPSPGLTVVAPPVLHAVLPGVSLLVKNFGVLCLLRWCPLVRVHGFCGGLLMGGLLYLW
ncbi:uncharacterized protein LOC120353381 [Nilaparvata lugens]|uniref:uncharacterized protein LOC120353381 n=1 Tax=Nilaparvata lugens TaxID=108931 RepID=UPI00193D9287|nr:uncharacterized protein LOC120353381 [Nilaparvata lugens]